MPSLVVMVKIKTQLWGGGRRARTLAMGRHRAAGSILCFKPTVRCCIAQMGAAPQIVEATRLCMADREVARVVLHARIRGWSAASWWILVWWGPYDCQSCGSPVAHHSLCLCLCRRSKSFPQPCLATSDSAAQASTLPDRTSNHLSSRACFTCYGQARQRRGEARHKQCDGAQTGGGDEGERQVLAFPPR